MSEEKPSYHVFSGGHLFSSLLIMLAGCLPYLNTLHGAFVFDDEKSIELNLLIRKLSNFLPGEAGWREYPTRVIGYLSFAMNYRIHELDVFGYHACNIAIHIACAFLIYVIVFLVQKTPYFQQSQWGPPSKGLPLLTALLFAVHPVQTQAVSYIVQRFASLATLFYLGSIMAYINGRLAMKGVLNAEGGQSLRWHLVSYACALLAMKTKEIAFTLPAVVILFEILFFEGKWRKRLLLVLPYFLIALVIPLSLIRMDDSLGRVLSDTSEVTRVQTDLPRSAYLFTQFRVIVTYLRLLVFPVNQNLDYDYSAYHSFYDPAVFLSLLLILLLLGSTFLLHARSVRGKNPRMRLSAFGIFWFFIALSVESSVIPITDVIFEHRLYLPLVGASLAVVSFASLAYERLSLKSKGTWAAVLSAFVLLPLAVATHERNHVWQDNITLWEDVARKSPGKARPHYNLGYAYSVRGRTDEAIEQYLWSLRLRPNYPQAWDNLGVDYARKGLYKEAIEAHEKAAWIDPDFPQPYYNLGRIYLTAFPGRGGEAAGQFRKAVALKPDYTDAWVNLAAAYIQQGDYQKAAQAAERAVALAPERADGHFNLAVARFQQGNRPSALAEMEVVMGLDPGMGDALKRFLAVSSH